MSNFEKIFLESEIHCKILKMNVCYDELFLYYFIKMQFIYNLKNKNNKNIYIFLKNYVINFRF